MYPNMQNPMFAKPMQQYLPGNPQFGQVGTQFKPIGMNYSGGPPMIQRSVWITSPLGIVLPSIIIGPPLTKNSTNALS